MGVPAEAKEKGTLKFPKSERLHHRSLVEGLFRDGKSFYEFPFRVTWKRLTGSQLASTFRCKVPEDISTLQMMVVVPKKKRKRAVDRVLLRRRIKEAYRLHRIELRQATESDQESGTLSVSIMYIHDKNLSYSYIEGKMKEVLVRLQELFINRERSKNV